MDEKNKVNLNFAFFGTPDVASETLLILKNGGYVPSLIVTSPDRPQGRKMILTPPPAKVWAEENGIPYLQPEKLDKDFINKLKEKAFELFVVVAYGKIIPEEILNMPKYGSINVHYSLLPKYRGASPIESAILNGDTDTGVTIQKMVFKMDVGPVIALKMTGINRDETAPELRSRLIKIGGELLIETLPKIISRETEEIVQDESQATYCTKIKKEDGQIDLSDDPIKNYNKFRAYAYWPRTFFFKDGKRIIITEATLENSQLVIKKVLPEGKKEISWSDFNFNN